MSYNFFIIGIVLISILLIILIICYRTYVYNQCKYDMKCLKNKLVTKLNNLNQNLKNYINISTDSSTEIEIDKVEGFFGGFGNFFSGSTPTDLPVSPGSLPTENLNILEKKINDKMIISNKFPPDLNGNIDDFKDLDNRDLLKITNKGVKPNIENKDPVAIFDKPIIKNDLPIKKIDSINISKPVEDLSIKKLLGKCQFYNDKCPIDHHELGNFSIQGVSNGISLMCGNVENTKPAKAIAQIKNNMVYEIHITDPGSGFNPILPPKITIEGGKGTGAIAEGIVDDNGLLKIIKILSPGYNYSDTPNILIDPPYMNGSCHLCCKD